MATRKQAAHPVPEPHRPHDYISDRTGWPHGQHVAPEGGTLEQERFMQRAGYHLGDPDGLAFATGRVKPGRVRRGTKIQLPDRESLDH